MRKINFDLDALRSFSVGMELGSFAKAADRLGRSTSAVSAQMKKLEEQAGRQILTRSGRGMILTDAGEVLLSYARRILELNDEATMAMRGLELEGWVRLGLQEDFGELLLPEILGRFARSHPGVRIEARIARNAELLTQVCSAQLDLALAWHTGGETAHRETMGSYPLQWIGRAGQAPDEWSARARREAEPVPLVALESPCLMRTQATEALDRAGIPWRLVFTSPSLAGVWAAVAAGLGVTVRTRLGLPSGLRALRLEDCGLPPLPSLELAMYKAEAESAACRRLEDIIRQGIGEMASSAAHRMPMLGRGMAAAVVEA
ncbi:LysR substrate-binding domain-containing protein [Noviherbaspirillum aerium]|uniref:LysR substrate-binding domain-containing protein n=1 Tax=Noviherbaspirillum aerium TaxID=2588497 RepID=UPI00124D3466|nr:LysR substrate-binding domain-containing protein [Noviherbaspirillum aerium]